MRKVIESGEKYKCLKDYFMDDGSRAYIQGEEYLSLSDGELCSEKYEDHSMPIDNDFWDFFELVTNEPKHYDNSKGSLYQFCEDQKLNSYEFDIIKRVMRCRKKGNFREDLEKTKFLIDLYLIETADAGQ